MKKNKNILTVPRQKIQDTTLDLFEIIEERKKKVVEDIQWHKEYVDNKINKSLPHLREIDNKITEEAKQL